MTCLVRGCRRTRLSPKPSGVHFATCAGHLVISFEPAPAGRPVSPHGSTRSGALPIPVEAQPPPLA